MSISSTRTALSSLNDKVIHPGAGQVKVTVTEPRNVREALESIVQSLSTSTPPGAGSFIGVHWHPTGRSGRRG